MDPRTPHDRSQPEGFSPSPTNRPTADGAQASRPADGAARSEAPSQLDTGWRGNAGATDFLGLDLDAAPAQPARPAPTNATNQPATFEVDSWLMSMESEPAAAPGSGALASATTLPQRHSSPVPGAEAASAIDALDASSGGDPVPESFDEESAPERARPKRGRAVLAFATVAFLAVAGGGAWWWMEQRAQSGGIEIAQTAPAPAAKPTPPAKPADAKTPSAGAPATQPTKPALASTGTTGQEPPASAPPVETALAQPTTSTPDVSSTTSSVPEVVTSSTPPVDLPVIVSPADPAPPVVAVAPPSNASVPATSTTWSSVPSAATTPSIPAGTTTIVRSSTRLPRLPALATKRAATAAAPVEERALRTRRATAADLASLWMSPEIPEGALHAAEPVRTLRVGLVNVLLHSGEVVEGDLYSLGGGTVALQTTIGRVHLAAKDVAQVSRGASPASAGVGAPGARRVEVVGRHASFFGRLLARDGDRVVILTDDGMRLSIDALEVRGVTEHGSRVVGIVDPTL